MQWWQPYRLPPIILEPPTLPLCREHGARYRSRLRRAEQQATQDKKVISDFAAHTARDDLKIDGFYDVAELPHPKEIILRAFEREIMREPLDARVENLKIGARFLLCVQKNVDPYKTERTIQKEKLAGRSATVI
jgi:hypothetical protein